MGIMKTLTINGETFNVTPVVPTSSVTLLASAWVGNGDTYSQVVGLPGVSLHTKVDLQPTPEQLEEFHYLTLGFVAENEGGIVTVFAIGDKPTNDHTIQVTLTEVEADGKIRGNTVGTSIPRADWNQEDPTKADYIKNKPNINDQTPTFEQAPISENIVSGENLSTIFGKVMRAIADSTSHLQSVENPHGVSAEQVGARPSSWMPTASDVGARPNTWLPTIGEIGAAPAGYGLGGNGAAFQFSEIDNIKKNGGYATSCPNTTMFGMTFHYAFMRVDVWDQNNCRQTMYPVSSLGVIFTRHCSSGVWQPWECLNPPMILGVEYRTIERYNGKPVYVQCVNFGAMPNASSKQVLFTSSGNIGRALSVTGSSSIGDTIPYRSDASDISICVAKGVNRTQNYVTIKTTNDQSSRTAEAVVKYTLT